MVRPCFLVVDREFPGSISTRKLVIETAKFNVITAYSAGEAIATLEKFPAVSGVIFDAGIGDMSADDTVAALKKLQPNIPVVVINTPGADWCAAADYHLEFFSPVHLLALLQKLEPEHTKAISAHEDKLSEETEERS
jgi:response regulator RpfG family c-di-GMP phosphodiesterase